MGWKNPVCFVALMFSISANAATSTEVAELLASDRLAPDNFGVSVAIDGTRALVAAHLAPGGPSFGSVYVYDFDGTTWNETQELTASDGATIDQFGFSVALDGDRALIGARLDDGNELNSGSAYVFDFDGTTWTESQKLVPSDGVLFGQFGWSVALDGNRALVGARVGQPFFSGLGSAYVFEFDGTTWHETQKLTAMDATVSDEFGYAVALEGNRALVGSRADDDYGADSGSLYVYDFDGMVWNETKLTASDGAPGSQLGFSVALDGNRALASAILDNSSVGSAYVFDFDGTNWIETQKLTPSDGAALDHFGYRVALDGNRALIASRLDDDKGSDSGSAYVFELRNGVWSEAEKLTAGDGQPVDRFGRSVALDGTTAIVGAPGHDHPTNFLLDAGAAYIFALGETQPPLALNVQGTPNPTPINTSILLTADIDDSATGNSNIDMASYSLDGGNAFPMGASDGAFDSPVESVSGSIPAFEESGVHDVCVSGVDASGNTSSPECTFIVIYDASAGFVTGGGWIDSAAGAYNPDASVSGKANFGFVSKYKKGATVPSGSTEFQFTAGSLNFHSESYDWLVVSGGGATAQFKGAGTINGSLDFNGNPYRFMVWAEDGSPLDTFRIRIWSESNGAESEIYDNGFNQSLGGGSIVIHKGQQKK